MPNYKNVKALYVSTCTEDQPSATQQEAAGKKQNLRRVCGGWAKLQEPRELCIEAEDVSDLLVLKETTVGRGIGQNGLTIAPKSPNCPTPIVISVQNTFVSSE